MLYAVRNACVHGDFDDPCSIENNDLLQSAFELLHTLLLEYLALVKGEGAKTTKLHP